MIFLILCWFVFRFIYIKLKYKHVLNIKKEILINCFALYIILLIRITLLPIILISYNFSISFEDLPINFIPIIPLIDNLLPIDTMHIFLIIKNTFGNILLFIPFGFLAPLIFKKITNLKYIILSSFMISLSIELLQLIENIISISENTRITDINDIILNVLGAILGYIILKKLFLPRENLNNQGSIKK